MSVKRHLMLMGQGNLEVVAASDYDALQAQNAELERKVYVPGLWRCAKCEFEIVSTNLHASTGNFSANNSPQQCANGCGPMWRVTERDAGNRMVDRYDALREQNAELVKLVEDLGVYVPRECEECNSTGVIDGRRFKWPQPDLPCVECAPHRELVARYRAALSPQAEKAQP